MEYKQELNRFTEFAEKIMQNDNITQKATGLHNLLSKVKNTVSDVITSNAEAINSNTRCRINDYKQNIHLGFIHSRYNDIIEFVNNDFADIVTFENDTPEKVEHRKKKLKECSQIVSISPIETGEWEHFNNGNMRIDRQKTKPHPDLIYCQSGIYRLFDQYHDDTFYRLCLNIKQDFEFLENDFDSVCRLVCLYVAIKNELQVVIDEMQLLGMDVPKIIQPDAEPDTEQPQQITLHPELLQALQTGGFIDNAAARPLKWTATNSKTHGKQISKISLLDLLCLLDYTDRVIKDKVLLKETFNIEFKANNYTDITDNNGNLKRPIISEYHKKLSDIVSKSKQK
jgi:phage-related holin